VTATPWIVDGELLPVTFVSKLMVDAYRASEYWCDDLRILDKPYGASPVLSDPNVFDGEFTILVWADNTENAIYRYDALMAMARFAEERPEDWKAMRAGESTKDALDQFFQICTFGEIVYYV
jgi:hypothetical protein